MLVCGNPLKVIGWTFLNSFSLMWMGVKFWEDEWCRDCALKVAFLELYGISLTKESLVSKVMWFSDGQLHCDFQLRHPPQDWEETLVDLLWGICFIPRMCGVLVTTNFARNQH